MPNLPMIGFFLTLICVSKPLSAEAVSYFYSNLPPYEYQDEQQQAQGIGIDAIRRVLQQTGFTADFELFSVQRGLNALHNKIDFTAVVSPTVGQQRQYVVSQYPVYQIQLGVVRLKQSPALGKLQALTHQPYLVLAETKFTHLLQRPELSTLLQQRYEVTEQQDALRLILKGRYSYFLSYGMTAQQLAHPDLVFEELEICPVHLMLSRKNKDAQRLMQRVDQTLRATQP